MDIKLDSKLYDTLHEGLLRALFTTIKTALEEAKFSPEVRIPDEFMEGIVETITFNVAAVIDGGAVMEFEDKEISPYLIFKSGEHLVKNDVGSYLHEMVMGYLDEYDLDEL